MNTDTAKATTAEFAVIPDNYATAAEWADAEKVARQCENPNCKWAGILEACQLQFAHKRRGTALKDKNGNRLFPANMVKNGASAWGARYGMATILAEVLKCRVLCACCHALETKNGG